MARRRQPTITAYITPLEAGELCSREHELGTCGSVVVEVRLAGQPVPLAESRPEPSFPRAYWGETLELPILHLGTELILELVDADPLQQPRGEDERFSFGRVCYTLEPGTEGPHLNRRLEGSPGAQGFFSFEVSFEAPPPERLVPSSRRPQKARLPSAGTDFCGVLLLAVRPVGTAASFEVSVGPCSYSCWKLSTEDGIHSQCGPKRLLVIEQNPLLSVHAAMASRGTSSDQKTPATGQVHLAKVAGPVGPTSLLFEDSPEPLQLFWRKGDPELERPMVHMRFFQAEFLRPGQWHGLSVRVSLLVASNSLPLPLVLHIPGGLFPSVEPQESAEVRFGLVRVGDCIELCLPDPLRLVNHSVWRLRTQLHESTKDSAEFECFIDIFALQLELGRDKTMTVPLGPHTAVLRFELTEYKPEMPRPVLGVTVPESVAAAVSAPRRLLEPDTAESMKGEVVGLLVHTLSVHSPVVSECVLTSGPEAGAMFQTLPHQSARVFLAAEADERGRVLVKATLPAHRVTSTTDIKVSPEPCQIHWRFPTPSGDVVASALVTFLWWPSVTGGGGLTATPILAKVLAGKVPKSLQNRLPPLQLRVGPSRSESFTWDASKSGPAEVLLLPSGLNEHHGLLQAQWQNSGRFSSFVLPLLFACARSCRADLQALDLCLPILWEPEEGSKDQGGGFATTLYLPVHMQLLPVKRPAAVAPPDLGTEISKDGCTGVLLVQSLCAAVRPPDEAHAAHCTARGSSTCWEPTLELRASLGRQLAKGRARSHGQGGVLATWVADKLPRSPQGVPSCQRIMPDILRLPLCPGEEHRLRFEFRFSCRECNAEAAYVCKPRAALSELHGWRSTCVHLDVAPVEEPLKKVGGGAARLLLCPSAFCRHPVGFLMLTVRPLREGGTGVEEFLEDLRRDWRPSLLEDEQDAPVGLRLAVEGRSRSEQGLLYDGRSGGSIELCIETSSEDPTSSLLVELQAMSGARRVLASVCLAALGPLGEGDTSTFPLIFSGKRILEVAARYERTEVFAPPSGAPRIPDAGRSADEAQAAARRAFQQEGYRLVDNILCLGKTEPEHMLLPSAAAEKAPPFVAGVRATPKRRPRSASNHPYLERGKFHWLTMEPGKARSRHRAWHQEMDRKRPKGVPLTDGHKSEPIAIPEGFDHERDANEGPAYRHAFIWEQRKGLALLQHELHRVKYETTRAEKRLASLRHFLNTVRQSLPNPEHGPSRLGGMETHPTGFLSASLPSQPPTTDQVCTVCGVKIPSESRYCAVCLPAILEEALLLQSEVGEIVAQKAAVKWHLERQHRQQVELEVHERKLLQELDQAKDAAAPKQSGKILEVLTQLRSLQRDSAAKASVEEERLQALREQTAEAEEQHQQTSTRLQLAMRRGIEVKGKLSAVSERIADALQKVTDA